MNSQWIMETPVGPLYLVASDNALRGAFWKKQSAPMISSLDDNRADVKMIARAAKQLEEYFAGKRQDFNLPLDLEGTAFQKSVWAELAKIPYGETVAYADIAKRLNMKPGASRAVGTANGRNPISIIVPCHRVIQTGGGLGGYAGGLTAKERLLKLEQTQN